MADEILWVIDGLGFEVLAIAPAAAWRIADACALGQGCAAEGPQFCGLLFLRGR